MRNIAESYSPKLNFWDTFESFKDVDPFSKMRSSDKSPGKRISSMRMWAIALACDPKSDFYNLSDKRGKIALAMRRNHRMEVEWDSLDEIIISFTDMYLNQSEKSLLSWERRMKERDEFLDKQEWSFDYYNEEGDTVKGNADQLDKMHGLTHKHYKDYQVIIKELQELNIKDQNAKKSNVKELDV